MNVYLDIDVFLVTIDRSNHDHVHILGSGKNAVGNRVFAMTLKKSCETVPFKFRDYENFMILGFEIFVGHIRMY